jgi:serine/threonine-protein kinase
MDTSGDAGADGVADGILGSDETLASRSVLSRVKDLLGFEPGVQLRSLSTESGLSISPAEIEGKYVIEREIGKGGMGKVLLAFDRDLRRRVAVKVILPSIAKSQDHLARFVEEAQITGQLEHPGIPPVHEIAINKGGEIFFTMKLLKGRTLKEIIRDLHIGRREMRERFSRTKLLMFLQGVCHAVHFAHEKGVIHRDIKPENIMIGDYGEVQLMDWGLAKVLGLPDRHFGAEEPVETVRVEQGMVTAHGLIHGTLLYMSPEQAQARHELVDRRSDIYSLGATLYEILTLLPPRIGENVQDLLEECRLGLTVAPSRRAPRQKVPPALEEICLRAMEYHPDDRFSTAAELADAIQNYIDGSKEEERRRTESDQRVDDASRVLREHALAKRSLEAARRALDELERNAGNHPTAEQKRSLRELRSEAEAHATALARKYTEAQTALAGSLTAWPENTRARRALGELYLERFLKADAEGNEADRIFYGGLIEQVNDGHFDRVLQGNGTLEITSELAPEHEAGSEGRPCEMALYRVAEREAIFVAEEVVARGKDTLELPELPMGRYFITIEKEGCVPTRLPVCVGRNGEIRARVRLYPTEAVPPDFAYVPAGPFLMYSDPHVISSYSARRIVDVPGFAVGIYPVTCGEYLEFLNHFAQSNLDEAQRRAPRQSESSGHLWTPVNGRFRLPEDTSRYPWSEKLPVFSVSFEDALAYSQYRRERDGRAFDLLTEAEWEKASKGVDGRYYSWGNHFDNEYANNFFAFRDRPPGPVAVDTFPQDCSPYGVRGMVGNVGDWCYFDDPGRLDVAAVRGGNWALTGESCRLSYRRSTSKTYVSDRFGIRLKLAL